MLRGTGCPNCRIRMIATGVASCPIGAETLSFECLRCGHRDSMKSDPMKSESAGWLSGELGHSTAEHRPNGAEKTLSTVE